MCVSLPRQSRLGVDKSGIPGFCDETTLACSKGSPPAVTAPSLASRNLRPRLPRDLANLLPKTRYDGSSDRPRRHEQILLTLRSPKHRQSRPAHVQSRRVIWAFGVCSPLQLGGYRVLFNPIAVNRTPPTDLRESRRILTPTCCPLRIDGH